MCRSIAPPALHAAERNGQKGPTGVTTAERASPVNSSGIEARRRAGVPRGEAGAEVGGSGGGGRSGRTRAGSRPRRDEA
eukprot:scaffold107868_cov29-Tisochrysis_lutea.AAC.1